MTNPKEKETTSGHSAIRRFEFYVHGGQVIHRPPPPFSGGAKTVANVVFDKESGTIEIVPVSEEEE